MGSVSGPSRGHGAAGEMRRLRPFAGPLSDRRVRPLAVIRRCATDRPDREQHGGPCHSRYDPVGGTVRGGPQVSLTPSGTLADPQHIIADLRRELEESRAERDKAQCKLNKRTTERDEALAREAAMAEVLLVINASPGDPAPVFQAILDKALRLCEATHGHIWRVEGQQAHAVALRGDERFVESMRRESPTDLLSGRPLTQLARGEHVVRIPDATTDELYRSHPAFREFIDAS